MFDVAAVSKRDRGCQCHEEINMSTWGFCRVGGELDDKISLLCASAKYEAKAS